MDKRRPALEGQGRVGLRLRTSSGGDGPPSPSTADDPRASPSLLDMTSQPRKRTSTGASRSKRIMWSTQNSIIQSFSTGSHGTMTVSWEACPRTVLIVKVSSIRRARCTVAAKAAIAEMFALSPLPSIPCHTYARSSTRALRRFRAEVEVGRDRPGDG